LWSSSWSTESLRIHTYCLRNSCHRVEGSAVHRAGIAALRACGSATGASSRSRRPWPTAPRERRRTSRPTRSSSSMSSSSMCSSSMPTLRCAYQHGFPKFMHSPCSRTGSEAALSHFCRSSLPWTVLDTRNFVQGLPHTQKFDSNGARETHAKQTELQPHDATCRAATLAVKVLRHVVDAEVGFARNHAVGSSYSGPLRQR